MVLPTDLITWLVEKNLFPQIKFEELKRFWTHARAHQVHFFKRTLCCIFMRNGGLQARNATFGFPLARVDIASPVGLHQNIRLPPGFARLLLGNGSLVQRCTR